MVFTMSVSAICQLYRGGSVFFCLDRFPCNKEKKRQIFYVDFCCLFTKILITNSFFLATTWTQKKYPFCKYDLCGNCNTSIDLKIIHTIKGDTFYFGYDIYKLLTCRSDGIAWFLIVMMYIERLFLNDLRFTTAPTPSVICDQEMSYIGSR